MSLLKLFLNKLLIGTEFENAFTVEVFITILFKDGLEKTVFKVIFGRKSS